MHRVELKVGLFARNTDGIQDVPNAPCGVERRDIIMLSKISNLFVPNAPCGVESLILIVCLL